MVLASGLICVVSCSVKGPAGGAVDRVLALVDRIAVDRNRLQSQFVAIEDQRHTLGHAFPAMHQRALDDQRLLGVQFEGEVHPFKHEVGRAVICQMDDLAGGRFHGASWIGKSQFLVLAIISLRHLAFPIESETTQIPAAVSLSFPELSLNRSELIHHGKSTPKMVFHDVFGQS